MFAWSTMCQPVCVFSRQLQTWTGKSLLRISPTPTAPLQKSTWLTSGEQHLWEVWINLLLSRMVTSVLKYCWLFYVLATSTVISGWAPTCDSVHLWWPFCAAPVGNQATATMTWYPTQSHYPDTEVTSSCPILLMPNTRLGSDIVINLTEPRTKLPISHTRFPRSTDSTTAPGLRQ